MPVEDSDAEMAARGWRATMGRTFRTIMPESTPGQLETLMPRHVHNKVPLWHSPNTLGNRVSDPPFSRFGGDFPGDSRFPIGRESGNRDSESGNPCFPIRPGPGILVGVPGGGGGPVCTRGFQVPGLSGPSLWTYTSRTLTRELEAARRHERTEDTAAITAPGPPPH
jgi:hypothetical protein